jgi:hypothetical protein
MSSNINPNNINGNYPVAGQDNDSQGFRDNFTNILNNFAFAASEISALQSGLATVETIVSTTGNITSQNETINQNLTVGGISYLAQDVTLGGVVNFNYTENNSIANPVVLAPVVADTYDIATSSTAFRNAYFGNIKSNTLATGSLTSSARFVNGTIVAGAPASVQEIDLLNGDRWYFTSNSTANFTFNFTAGAGGTPTLNSTMAVGSSILVQVLVTQGASPHIPSGCQIDGTSTTVKWSNGVAPIVGNVNAINVYDYTITKTATSTYTVFAQQRSFA